VDRTRSRLLPILLLGVLGMLGGALSARAEPRHPGSPSWVLAVQGDRLTVELHGVPLGEVLAELARQATLHVALSEATGHELVSVSFRHVPLDQAIRRLLGTRSYALVYAPSASGPGAREPRRISELIVLSGKGQPVEGEEARQAEPIEAEVLGHPDPQVRIAALEQWAAYREGDSVDPLTHAMVDPDEQVRARAQALWEGALEGAAR
jgi:HEAT repeat protein